MNVVLPLSAMPTGYSEDSSTTTESAKTFCNYKRPTDTKLYAARTYVKGSGLASELIGVGLRQYASPGAAKLAYEALSKTLHTCRTDTDTDGTPLKYAPMNVPAVGEGSLGVRISSGDQVALQLFALSGAVLVNVGTGGILGSNGNLIGPLLEQQVDRYKAAATK